jgi:adenine-specific DNA-methyltransferase
MSSVSGAARAIARLCAFHRKRGGDARQTTRDLVEGREPEESHKILSTLPPEWADHAISCVHAVLMPDGHRKHLGAFFTPPHLADHLVRRLQHLGVAFLSARFRDPASGGAAFLVPLARRMVQGWMDAGMPREAVARTMRERLQGSELDPGLADLSRRLIARMLRQEMGFPAKLARQAASIVACRDGLLPPPRPFDHEVGNPPYRRLSAAEHAKAAAAFPDITSGRLNQYALFVRRALDHVPAGGLVAHVVPASLIGGSEFRQFRLRMSQLARVEVLDVVQKRSGIFLDATQDACCLVLRRRETPLDAPPPHDTLTGILHNDGILSEQGRAMLPSDGSPWALPRPGGADGPMTSLLALGWRPRVGYLVANRQGNILHQRRAKGRMPLIWAASITAEGGFDFERGCLSRQAGRRAWVDVSSGATWVVRGACVALQRVSSSSQSRRLTAAVIPQGFVSQHGGVVGENHVLLLTPEREDAVAAEVIAALLNSPEASAAYARVGGTATISAKLLATLPISSPCAGGFRPGNPAIAMPGPRHSGASRVPPWPTPAPAVPSTLGAG